MFFRTVDELIFLDSIFKNESGRAPKFAEETTDEFGQFLLEMMPTIMPNLQHEFWSTMFFMHAGELVSYDPKKLCNFLRVGQHQIKLNELCGNKVYRHDETTEIDVKIFLKLNKQEFIKQGLNKPENDNLAQELLTNKPLSAKFGQLTYSNTSLYKLG